MAEPTPTFDRRPHSRACGWRAHPHGAACHPNCPSCGGVQPPSSGVSFSFPAPAPRLSLNDRLFWAKRAELTRAWRHAANIYARQSRAVRDRHLPPSDVRVTFEVSDPGRRRDPHNAVPTVKAVIDGLVDAHYWPDDCAEWVTVIDPQYVKGADRVRIDITPKERVP